MLRRLANMWRAIRRRNQSPEDPYASVRHPVRRGPPSNSAAVALDEPVPPSFLRAIGSQLTRDPKR